MRKEITTIILLLFSISLISAVTIYTGDSYTKTLDEQYHHYEITENTSEVNLEVSQDSNHVVTITPDKYSQNVSFTITFYDEEDEPIDDDDDSSDGGSSGGSSFVPKKKTTDTPETTNTTETTTEQINPPKTPKEKLGAFKWLIIPISLIVVGMLLWLWFRGDELDIKEEIVEPEEDSNIDAREEEKNE